MATDAMAGISSACNPLLMQQQMAGSHAQAAMMNQHLLLQQQMQVQQRMQMMQNFAAVPGGLAAAATIPGMMPGMMPIKIDNKKQREIYVGNLPSGVTEVLLKELFSQVLGACDEFETASGGAIVLNVQLCGGGQYAFVEFRDEECCETAMQFSGMVLSGKNLKINHPNGYIPGKVVKRYKPSDALLAQFGLSGIATVAPGSIVVSQDNKKVSALHRT